MSERKDRILTTALELFAKESFASVSTNRIAKQAGVSEGLIFKHFKSKHGLLEAIIDDATRRAGEIFAPLMTEPDPAKVIRLYIELPFNADPANFDYWRLQFKLKWEEDYSPSAKLEPMQQRLAWALRKLGYKQADFEAKTLMQIMEGVAVDIMRGQMQNPTKVRNFLLRKYLPN